MLTNEFLLNVFSSMFATLVTLGGSWLISPRLRAVVLTFVSKATGSGIERVFRNDTDAAGEIVRAVRGSNCVRILSMRAFRLLKDDAPLSFLLADQCSISDTRVLLADPTCPAVRRRAEEFLQIDRSYTINRYIEDIRWSANQVAENHRNERLKMRMHRQPAFVRLLITDECLFLSFFLKSVHGDNSPVLKVHRKSPIYESLTRYFDWVWECDSAEFEIQPMRAGEPASR